MCSSMMRSLPVNGRMTRSTPRRLLLVTLLVSLLAAVCLLQPSTVAIASPDPVAHANPEALVVPKSKSSANSDHADAAAKPVKANNQDGDDDDLTIDAGDDIAELGDPMAPATTDTPTRTRTGDPEVITDVVADGGDDAAVVVEAAALFDDPASDVIDVLVPPPEPEHVPGAKLRRDARNIKRDEAEFTQAVELDKIVPVTTDAADDAPAAEPAPAPVPGQVVAGRPTSSSPATSVRSTATRPSGSSSTSARATSTARPGTGGSGGDSNPDSHSGDQTLEILITDNSGVGTGPGTGTGKGANVDFAVNGFGVSVSGSLKRGAPAQAQQGHAQPDKSASRRRWRAMARRPRGTS
ncbi:hypothetical protein BCR44DRAFT_1439774, partial [Catenaria anguillulae PL171]